MDRCNINFTIALHDVAQSPFLFIWKPAITVRCKKLSHWAHCTVCTGTPTEQGLGGGRYNCVLHVENEGIALLLLLMEGGIHVWQVINENNAQVIVKNYLSGTKAPIFFFFFFFIIIGKLYIHPMYLEPMTHTPSHNCGRKNFHLSDSSLTKGTKLDTFTVQ